MPAVILTNPDDPMFSFEHMMQHRQYFGIMGDHNKQGTLSQFSVLPYLLDPSFGTHLPAQSWNLNHQQAHNDFNADLPNTSSDGYTVTPVTPPDVTGIGNSTGTTSLTLTGLSGSFLMGSSVTGAGVPAGTTIVSYQGGNVYITNQPTTLTNVAVTISHPPYQQATPIGGAGSFGILQPGILLEGNGGTPENQAWWTFLNHQQHFIANHILLPYPTTAPMTAGTPPGQITASNPWWWQQKGPLIYPFW
jgi:hypothetical protein